MSVYSSADILGREMGWNRTKRGVLDFVKSFAASLSKSVSLELTVPTNIFIRTNLLCEYIQEQVGVEFGLHNFLMVLYLDFISSSIKKYDPLKIVREISQTYDYNDTIKIVIGNDVYLHNRREANMTTLHIEMDKKDVLKGEMLLCELDDLLGCQISFEKLLTNLWVNFIEKYKKGDGTEAFNSIVKMLKKSLR